MRPLFSFAALAPNASQVFPVGILALQGGFAVHQQACLREGLPTRLIRKPCDLQTVSALIFPGGESSVQLKLLLSSGLWGPLQALLQARTTPVLGTCAGLILLAKRVQNPQQTSFGVLDVTVARNAWGGQRESFEAQGDRHGIPMTFIRAPRIIGTSEPVEILETLQNEPVLVRQGLVWGATFHPELLTIENE